MTNLSYCFGISCMFALCYKFFMWFKSHHDFIILLYVIEFSILAVYLIVSLTLLNYQYSYADSDINIRYIKRQIADSSNNLSDYAWLASGYNYLSIVTFLIMWVVTVVQLKVYSTRMGMIKYWAIVAIPLAYFLIPLFANVLGLFENLMYEYGTQFRFLYIIIVSPYKQIGGLLFGLVFWITANKIKRENIRYFVFISGVGMILLFGSTVIHNVTFILAPPLGIISLLFAGVASYFLLIGIYTSSKELANDVTIRNELYKIAKREHNLLKNVGAAETERVLEKRLEPIMKKTLSVEIEDTDLRNSEDYKEIIREVISELKANQNKPSNN
jgi:hypothetical protein